MNRKFTRVLLFALLTVATARAPACAAPGWKGGTSEVITRWSSFSHLPAPIRADGDKPPCIFSLALA